MSTPLVVEFGGKRLVLDGSGPAVVGRATSCEISIPIPDISRAHARLEPTADGWVYRDGGSRNGAYVHGQRVTDFLIDRPIVVQLSRPSDGPAIVLTPLTAGDAAPPPGATIVPGGDGTVVPAQPMPQHQQQAPPDPGGPARHGTVVIGRGLDCDEVVNDLLASRRHAEVSFNGDGTGRVRDLGSANGTYVDGVLVAAEMAVIPGQRITLGNTVFRFTTAGLQRVERGTDVVFAIQDLVVETDGFRRLDGVTFALTSRTLLGVLGTSGAGKSTLLKAITGSDPATAGRVLFDGHDLYASYGELRHAIGYVPQDDILHPHLTVAATLRFGAQLRFPADVTPAEREQRVQEVLSELGLSHRADALVTDLSGGQRKRLSVGLELLPRPSLLILDEPTSGLDPGNERAVMRLLRQLADGDRTVMVVTHATESLHLCDRVLFLARGGVTTYFGPPTELAKHFGVRDYPEAFAMIDELPDPRPLRDHFYQSPFAAELQQANPAGPSTPGLGGREPLAARNGLDAFRQLSIFTRRYLKLLTTDRRSLLILSLQAPVIGLLMLAVFGSGHLELIPGVPGSLSSGNVLMALVLGAIYTGASNSVREIVKERPILRREQNFGVSVVAYVLSKAIVLGIVTALQAVVLVIFGTLRQGGPSDALLLGSARLELIVAVAVCGFSAMCLGLLISALVSTADKAMTILPVVLFAQFLLAGLIFSVDSVGLQQASWLTSARWGLGAVAATADYPTLRGCEPIVEGTMQPECSSIWSHDTSTWFLNMGMLVVLSVVYLVVAGVVIARRDPAVTLAKRQARVRA